MDARILDYMQKYRFKKLLLCNDTDSGLRAVIAIHSTALGPATGGLRMWTYDREEDAIFDALRLARGMTYKYAQTPYQRLLESPDIQEATKAKLRAEHATLDPFELKKSIEAKLKNFFTVQGNLDRASTKT